MDWSVAKRCALRFHETTGNPCEAIVSSDFFPNTAVGDLLCFAPIVSIDNAKLPAPFPTHHSQAASQTTNDRELHHSHSRTNAPAGPPDTGDSDTGGGGRDEGQSLASSTIPPPPPPLSSAHSSGLLGVPPNQSRPGTPNTLSSGGTKPNGPSLPPSNPSSRPLSNSRRSSVFGTEWVPPVDHTTELVIQVTEVDHGRVSKNAPLSIGSILANRFKLSGMTQVLVQRVEPSVVVANFVELRVNHPFIDRGEMFRFQTHILQKVVYEGQSVSYAQCFSAEVRQICTENRGRVKAAYITPATRVVFRTTSGRFILLVQFSREMWQFLDDGTMYYERGIQLFLNDLFRHWKESHAKHLVTLVLFSRFVYSDDERLWVDNVNWHPDLRFWYKDYYKVIADMELCSLLCDNPEKASLLLKHDFLAFYAEIMNANRPLWDTSTPWAAQPWPSAHSTAWEAADASDPPEEAASSASGADPPPHPAQHAPVLGQNTFAMHGNVLEAINLALNTFEQRQGMRDTMRTQTSIALVTPSAGVFDVRKLLLRMTTERMIDTNLRVDVVCLAPKPLHKAPVFRFRSTVPDEWRQAVLQGNGSAADYAKYKALYFGQGFAALDEKPDNGPATFGDLGAFGPTLPTFPGAGVGGPVGGLDPLGPDKAHSPGSASQKAMRRQAGEIMDVLYFDDMVVQADRNETTLTPVDDGAPLISPSTVHGASAAPLYPPTAPSGRSPGAASAHRSPAQSHASVDKTVLLSNAGSHPPKASLDQPLGSASGEVPLHRVDYWFYFVPFWADCSFYEYRSRDRERRSGGREAFWPVCRMPQLQRAGTGRHLRVVWQVPYVTDDLSRCRETVVATQELRSTQALSKDAALMAAAPQPTLPKSEGKASSLPNNTEALATPMAAKTDPTVNSTTTAAPHRRASVSAVAPPTAHQPQTLAPHTPGSNPTDPSHASQRSQTRVVKPPHGHGSEGNRSYSRTSSQAGAQRSTDHTTKSRTLYLPLFRKQYDDDIFTSSPNAAEASCILESRRERAGSHQELPDDVDISADFAAPSVLESPEGVLVTPGRLRWKPRSLAHRIGSPRLRDNGTGILGESESGSPRGAGSASTDHRDDVPERQTLLTKLQEASPDLAQGLDRASRALRRDPKRSAPSPYNTWLNPLDPWYHYYAPVYANCTTPCFIAPLASSSRAYHVSPWARTLPHPKTATGPGGAGHQLRRSISERRASAGPKRASIDGRLRTNTAIGMASGHPMDSLTAEWNDSRPRGIPSTGAPTSTGIRGRVTTRRQPSMMPTGPGLSGDSASHLLEQWSTSDPLASSADHNAPSLTKASPAGETCRTTVAPGPMTMPGMASRAGGHGEWAATRHRQSPQSGPWSSSSWWHRSHDMTSGPGYQRAYSITGPTVSVRGVTKPFAPVSGPQAMKSPLLTSGGELIMDYRNCLPSQVIFVQPQNTWLYERQMKRWEDVFLGVRTLTRHEATLGQTMADPEMFWGSLSTPACLPLTTDYRPTQAQFARYYKEYPTNFSFDPDRLYQYHQVASNIPLSDMGTVTDECKIRALLVDLVMLRLSQGFQVITPSPATLGPPSVRPGQPTNGALRESLAARPVSSPLSLSRPPLSSLSGISQSGPRKPLAARHGDGYGPNGSFRSPLTRHDDLGLLGAPARPSPLHDGWSVLPSLGMGTKTATPGWDQLSGRAYTYFLSSGQSYHVLSYSRHNQEITFKRYKRTPAYDRDPITYHYQLWNKYATGYVPRSITFRYSTRPDFQWNACDQFVVDYTESLNKHSFNCIRLALIPLQDISNATFSYSIPQMRHTQLSEEEKRVVGFQKFLEHFIRSKQRDESPVGSNLSRGQVSSNHDTATTTTTHATKHAEGHGRTTATIERLMGPLRTMNMAVTTKRPSAYYADLMAMPGDPANQGLADPCFDFSKALTKPSSRSKSLRDAVPATSADELTHQLTTQSSLTMIAHLLQHPIHGLKLWPRRWHWRLYTNAFFGQDLVDWLLVHTVDLESREKAIQFAQSLMARQLFRHCKHHTVFLDNVMIYQLNPQFLTATTPSEQTQADARTFGHPLTSNSTLHRSEATDPYAASRAWFAHITTRLGSRPSDRFSMEDAATKTQGADTSQSTAAMATVEPAAATRTNFSSTHSAGRRVGSGTYASTGQILGQTSEPTQPAVRSRSGNSTASAPQPVPLAAHGAKMAHPTRTAADKAQVRPNLDRHQPSHPLPSLFPTSTTSDHSGLLPWEDKVPKHATMIINIDANRYSDRKELAILEYERTFSVGMCYHFSVCWLNCTGPIVTDQLSSWARLAERCGFKLVRTPVRQLTDEELTHHYPFLSTQPIELAVVPSQPDFWPTLMPNSPAVSKSSDAPNQSVPVVHSNHSSSPLPSTVHPVPTLSHPLMDPLHPSSPNTTSASVDWLDFLPEYFFEDVVLTQAGFILDQEAQRAFPRAVTANGIYEQPFAYTQYIHRSGLALVQIRGPGSFLWIDNFVQLESEATTKSRSNSLANAVASPPSAALLAGAAGSGNANGGNTPFADDRLTPTDTFGDDQMTDAKSDNLGGGAHTAVSPYQQAQRVRCQLIDLCSDAARLVGLWQTALHSLNREDGATLLSDMLPEQYLTGLDVVLS
ncbi:vacuolar membrane-associated protein iml1 [Dimargaris verticillata]|uniref:Vacuolar membrane-associated protein IML1 n=1 Tax=Dimargaris verticillata TaxID=2761393 RepID=A0A9W8AYW5_9FUNG|nr:vacuolar membrane-associated protein iml1 [Dimargaris verticillata]